MSQRGVDQDACPHPKDGGCEGWEANGLPNGTFYNNNIGECTSAQVKASDWDPTVTGTFIWSGFVRRLGCEPGKKWFFKVGACIWPKLPVIRVAISTVGQQGVR